MKIKIILILLLLITSKSVYSQEKTKGSDEIIIDAPQNGKIENGTYICNRFDWKIKIPNGFEVTSIERVKELEGKGHEVLSDVSNGVQIRKNIPHLIGFGINKGNTFSASFESLEGTTEMTLEEHRDFVATLMSDAYKKVETLKFELNKSDIKIGEHNFYKIQIRLYHAKTGQLLLTQEVYNSFIQNHLFSAAINYTTESTGKLLTKNFIKSLSN